MSMKYIFLLVTLSPSWDLAFGSDFMSGAREVMSNAGNGFKDDGNPLICAENVGEEPMKHFNLAKFLGEWYEVRNYGDDGYDRKGQRGNCAKFTFKYEDKKFHIRNSRLITRTKTNIMTQENDPIFLRQDDGFVTGFQESDDLILENGKVVFHYYTGIEKMVNNDPKRRDPPRQYKMDLREYVEVVATDYENYAIVHACSKGKMWGKYKFGWLLSRIPENHMDNSEKDEIFKTFDSILDKMNHKKVAKDYPNRYMAPTCFNSYQKSERPIPPWSGFTGDIKIKDSEKPHAINLGKLDNE